MKTADFRSTTRSLQKQGYTLVSTVVQSRAVSIQMLDSEGRRLLIEGSGTIESASVRATLSRVVPGERAEFLKTFYVQIGEELDLARWLSHNSDEVVEPDQDGAEVIKLGIKTVLVMYQAWLIAEATEKTSDSLTV